MEDLSNEEIWVACALAQQTCRQAHPILYRRMPRLIDELRISHCDGSYVKFLNSLSKAALIVLDNWDTHCPQSPQR